jgi:hypothetical protein
MTTKTQSDLTAQDQKLASGLAKLLGTSPPLVLSGKSYTVADLTAVLNARVNALAAASAAEATWRGAAKAATTQIASTHQLVADLRQALLIMFKNAPDALEALGIPLPKQRKSLTGPATVLKAARAEATRKARGTVGKRKKLAIKGVVPAQAETTPVVAASPATPPKT